jgi:hypothetical protein
LLNALRDSVPEGTKVEKEYRHRGTTLDVWLEWKGLLARDEVVFEIKVNLNRKTDYDRLVGQLEGMESTKNKTIVVLIGETDSALLGRLKERYAKYTQDDLARTMSIISIPIDS